MKKKFFLVVLFLGCILESLMAQNISGKVVDEKNDPLVGVNVLLLSKADSTYIAGTSTDKEGAFVFANREDAGTLMFSFIGYHLHWQVDSQPLGQVLCLAFYVHQFRAACLIL